MLEFCIVRIIRKPNFQIQLLHYYKYLLYQFYFLILLNPYLLIPIILVPIGLLYYYFIERKRNVELSILWGIFIIIFGLIFLFLLSQLEIQTFREDLATWKTLASVIILSGTLGSLILMILRIKSLRK